jgi:hypothetical protein
MVARQDTGDAIVAVQTEWNGWRTAMVHVADLDAIHWAQPAGAPRPLLHATVWCDRIVSGNVGHACNLTPPPHRLLVCLLKSHLPPAVFDRLAARADSSPPSDHAYSPVTEAVNRRPPLFAGWKGWLARR